jgi:hypothetical protein
MKTSTNDKIKSYILLATIVGFPVGLGIFLCLTAKPVQAQTVYQQDINPMTAVAAHQDFKIYRFVDSKQGNVCYITNISAPNTATTSCVILH